LELFDLWVIFIAIVSVGLVIDLFSDHFHRIFKFKKQTNGKTSYPFGTDVLWTIVWLSIGGLFTLLINFVLGTPKALEYITGYALEKSLSVDNMLVFVLIFTSLGIPHVKQHRVLIWAIFMRIGFIIAGVSLLETFHWMIYVLGGVLLFTSYRMIAKKEKESLDLEKHIVVRILRKFIPIDHKSEDHSFFKKTNGVIYATPMLVALIAVETTDVVFAMDSIPAILSITTDPFIVITSNIFAILGLRSLYFLIGNGIEKLHYLKYGLTILLAFIGVKMIISDIIHIDVVYSLIVIFTILAITFLASIFRKSKKSV
jgi:tellurite resistance protein TerC